MSDGVEVGARFGANLKRIRVGRGLSQEVLAFAASLHRTEVGMLERGVRLPRIDTLVKLCNSLDVAPDELLGGIVWAPRETLRGEWRASGDELPGPDSESP